MTHVFTWLKSGLYAHLYGRRCKILISSKRKVLVEFEDGERVITMLNALRRLR